MFEKANLNHYRLILFFGGFFYPLWKVLHIMGFHTPEPLWARIPALVLGSIFLYISFRKKENLNLIANSALILATYTTAEFLYLVAYQYFISPQAFTIYVIGAYVVLGCYTMCWKTIKHLVSYGLFALTCCLMTFGFLYFSDNGHLPSSVLVSYVLLFLLEFSVLFCLNYSYIRQTEIAINKINDDQLALVNSQKISQVSEMAGGIAHEIKNPFMSLGLNLELIEGKMYAIQEHLKHLSEEDRKKLSFDKEITNVNRAVDRISNTIDTLLIFSKNKSIVKNNEKSDYSLTKIVEDTLTLCTSKFFNSHINFRNQMLNSDVYVNCNKTEMYQAVYNLIINACEAIERDKNLINRQVGIKLQLNDETKEVSLIIEDSAKPVAPEHVSKLFIPFFTTKDLSKNYGTGLSISKTIIEDHCGRILYNDNPKNFMIVLKFSKSVPRVEQVSA